jgi:radical SAM protein with 4Fe4S-binding SPASM domain
MSSAINSDNTGDQRLPVLFSFITLRREDFGAIIFNPYLPAEEELDEIEAFIAEMCTGRYSLNSIRKQVRDRFDVNARKARKILDDTISKLNRLCSLDFADGKETAQPHISTPFKPSPTAYYSAPKSIIWDVTYSCNLKCPHCLTDSGKTAAGELNTKQALRLIDIFAGNQIIYLSLTGGEPFVRPDIMVLLEYLAQTRIRTDVATNGISLSEKKIRLLRDLPVFQIQVSIDGIGEEHDLFRGRKGAFKRSCTTLRRLRDEGISTSISTTATSRNINQIEQIINLALELGCESYKAIPFLPAGRGNRFEKNLRLGKQDQLELARILLRKSEELEGQINIDMETTFMFLLTPPGASSSPDGLMSCTAGYDMLSVGADGMAYPCPFLHDFPLGNLIHGSIADIWNNSPTLNYLRNLRKKDMTGPCRTCKFAPDHCHGGCRAAAWLESGNLNGTDPGCFRELLEEKKGQAVDSKH